MLETSAIERVAERDGHSALRLALETGGGQNELLAMIIEVQLFRPVIVGEIDVGPAIAVKISRRCRE